MLSFLCSWIKIARISIYIYYLIYLYTYVVIDYYYLLFEFVINKCMKFRLSLVNSINSSWSFIFIYFVLLFCWIYIIMCQKRLTLITSRIIIYFFRSVVYRYVYVRLYHNFFFPSILRVKVININFLQIEILIRNESRYMVMNNWDTSKQGGIYEFKWHLVIGLVV